MSLIIKKLYEHADLEPAALAFDTEYGINHKGRRITYGELAREVEELAALLKKNYVNCLAIELENCYEWLLIDLACLAAQVTCIPIPLFFSETQRQHIFTTVSIDALATAEPSTEGDVVVWLSERVKVISILPESDRRGLTGTAKITFTSGTTGSPKGVCISSEQLERVADSLAGVLPSIECEEHHLVMLPLSTLLENITGIYVPLMMGLTATILHGEAVGLTGSSQFEPERFAQALSSFRPATLVLTPALLAALIAIVSQQPKLAAPLKFIAVGGARVPHTLLEKATQLNLPVYEGYGLSECASVVAVNSPLNFSPSTVGQPLPHCTVRIAEDGEILVSPPGFLGYIDQPFTETWYPTGDLGAIDSEGYLTITGRKRNVIVTCFGRNISPEWVEAQAERWPTLQHLLLVGEIADSLTALVIGFDSSVVLTDVEALNRVLPDYAKIGRVVLLNNEHHHIGDLFTENGRPMRASIYARTKVWIYQNETQASVQIHEIFNRN